MTPSTPAAGHPRRVDESMTLLTEMMQRPLDPGYAAEAERRRAAGLPATPGGRSWRMGVVLLLVGLLVAVAAQALRQPKAAVQQQKDALVSQIDSRQRHADATQSQIAAWTAEVAALRGRALGASDQQLARSLSSAETAAQATTVHGPGVVLTVDDAKTSADGSADANPRTGEEDPGKVQSGDLQQVVNGLWQAGAEAIDINGHRLTATTAVRFAGEAILVDYRPLTRPYVLHVIGDPASLRKRFAATDGGRGLDQLGRGLGIQHSMSDATDLTLAGDEAVTLRYATAATPAAPSTPSTPSTAPEARP